ncbi:MAG: hypothetical protein MHM6MM_006469 [Cercozoa sp. M6MM]
MLRACVGRASRASSWRRFFASQQSDTEADKGVQLDEVIEAQESERLVSPEDMNMLETALLAFQSQFPVDGDHTFGETHPSLLRLFGDDLDELLRARRPWYEAELHRQRSLDLERLWWKLVRERDCFESWATVLRATDSSDEGETIRWRRAVENRLDILQRSMARVKRVLSRRAMYSSHCDQIEELSAQLDMLKKHEQEVSPAAVRGMFAEAIWKRQISTPDEARTVAKLLSQAL